jgi:tetraacyldisaccharide 4'-kinase
MLRPLAWLYGAIVRFRNRLYDRGWLHTTRPAVATICVGNLSTGGTGKTPFVEYLVDLLKERYPIATLSRGYRRRTRGFLLADPSHTAADIGDEPMQLHRKFPTLAVAVGEERVSAISSLMEARPGTALVILDDAFQHRPVRAHLNILLTDFSHPYVRDRMLPAGNLRDHPESASRADIIVVTKCPAGLSLKEVEPYRKMLELDPYKPLFFSHLVYSDPRDFQTWEIRQPPSGASVLLVCGIANPEPLVRQLERAVGPVDTLAFRDHHPFTRSDIERISSRFAGMAASLRVIVTTEKDAVRLEPYRSLLADLPVFVQPVAHAFMFSSAARFEGIIDTFMQAPAEGWVPRK